MNKKDLIEMIARFEELFSVEGEYIGEKQTTLSLLNQAYGVIKSN